MPEADLSKYRPLLKEALLAYRTDPSYAQDMAKQAGNLRTRQEAREAKASEEALT